MKRLLAIVAILALAHGCASSAPQGEVPPTKRHIGAGLVGDLYTPAGPVRPRPAVITLGGSEGGADPDAAVELSRKGFVALSLAYFGAPGLPDELGDIPLEYFDSAIVWLRAQPGVDPTRIAILGTSKGAEAALLVASRNPAIKAVVAGSPSSVAWQGIGRASRENRGSWSLAGKPVPFLAYDQSVPFTSVGDLYRRSWARQASYPAAAIAVERIAAPVLLICGEDDSLWPSCPMAQALQQRRGADAKGPQTQLLRYAGAGHGAFGLPFETQDPAARDGFGGTVGGNIAARADGWPRVLQFLDKALAVRR